jgi:aspartate aminotransferase
MRLEYQARRELVLELLAGAPGLSLQPPDATFYAFIKMEQGISAPEVVAAAYEQGVVVRIGTEYGPSGEGHIRITFVTDRSRLREGLLRLRSVIGSMAH